MLSEAAAKIIQLGLVPNDIKSFKLLHGLCVCILIKYHVKVGASFSFLIDVFADDVAVVEADGAPAEFSGRKVHSLYLIYQK